MYEQKDRLQSKHFSKVKNAPLERWDLPSLRKWVTTNSKIKQLEQTLTASETLAIREKLNKVKIASDKTENKQTNFCITRKDILPVHKKAR